MIEQTPPLAKQFRTLAARPMADVAGMGPFALPATFDKTKFASQFVEEGPSVEAQKADQPLQGLPFTAPGWKVWQGADKQQHQVTSGKIKYILMARPIEVQQDVNEAYATQSHDRRENSGEVVADDAAAAKGVDRRAIQSASELDRK